MGVLQDPQEAERLWLGEDRLQQALRGIAEPSTTEPNFPVFFLEDCTEVFDKLCRKTLEDHIDRYELSDEILALFQDDAVADPSDDENAGPVDIEAKDDDHGNENPRALARPRTPPHDVDDDADYGRELGVDEINYDSDQEARAVQEGFARPRPGAYRNESAAVAPASSAAAPFPPRPASRAVGRQGLVHAAVIEDENEVLSAAEDDADDSEDLIPLSTLCMVKGKKAAVPKKRKTGAKERKPKKTRTQKRPVVKEAGASAAAGTTWSEGPARNHELIGGFLASMDLSAFEYEGDEPASDGGDSTDEYVANTNHVVEDKGAVASSNGAESNGAESNAPPAASSRPVRTAVRNRGLYQLSYNEGDHWDPSGFQEDADFDEAE